MRRLILGTAGHIDHGKTALIRALTGVDTDRLPEEKRRGITIDLGFARLDLGDGVEMGVVDVPGHEGFIRNMLAGATGIDVVLLVVAADEGVMPQTREHLAIMELLGVRTGVVAVSKADMVDPEWLELVLDDLRGSLAATAFANAPTIAVSAPRGDGLPELRAALRAAAEQAAQRGADDVLRLPVDRVFSVRGTGTVVTGTIWSGAVAVDDSVTVLPAGRTARVRGVQVHGSEQRSASAGQRAAVALAGVEREEIARGGVIVKDGGWAPSSLLTARVRLLPDSAWELARRQRIRFHLGTAEAMARVRLLDTDRLGPGEEGWAQLRLESPVVARAGDRFVIRSYSPVTTIGGGVVHEPAARPRKRLTPDAAASLALLAHPDAGAVLARVRLDGWNGTAAVELPVRTPLAPPAVDAAIAELERAGEVVRVRDLVLESSVAEAAQARMLERLDAFHAAEPLRPGIDREELRRSLPAVAPAALAEWSLGQLLASGVIEARGAVVARAGFAPRLAPDQATARERILTAYEAAALAPPTLDELPAELRRRADFWPLLKLLEGDGSLVLVAPDLYASARAVRAAAALLRERFAGKGALAPTEFKELFAISRKHLIPLLEFFDKTGVTRRQGNERYVESV